MTRQEKKQWKKKKLCREEETMEILDSGTRSFSESNFQMFVGLLKAVVESVELGFVIYALCFAIVIILVCKNCVEKYNPEDDEGWS